MQDSLYRKLKDNSLSDNDEQYIMSTLILMGTQRDYKRGDPILLWPFFNSYKWLLFQLFLIIFFKGITLTRVTIRRDARPQTSFLFYVDSPSACLGNVSDTNHGHYIGQKLPSFIC